MNKLFTLITIMLFYTTLAFGFEKSITHKDFMLTLINPKDFTAGHNNFELTIKQNDTVIKASEIKVIFMMPEMPGMPKMSEEAVMQAKGNTFMGTVSFPHGGTWQIRIIFVINGKKYQAKSSLDF